MALRLALILVPRYAGQSKKPASSSASCNVHNRESLVGTIYADLSYLNLDNESRLCYNYLYGEPIWPERQNMSPAGVSNPDGHHGL
jgi:hypothetical protein